MSDAAALERVLAAIDPDAAIALLRKAIATPSVTGTEAAIARLLREELLAIGLDQVEAFDFVPGRANVWGRWGAGHGPKLLFAGHTDTVAVTGWAAEWGGTERENPFGGAIVDGAMWGRGAADMKAGVVAAVAALKAIRAAGYRPRGEVLTAFVGDEESGESGSGLSDGMRAIVARMADGSIPTPDFAIYPEPTTLDVYTAQMGFLIADITVHGVSAYFGLPWRGVDALKGAHKLLDRLFAYSDELWARTEHPLLGRAFLLVTTIAGGGYIAVPDLVRLSLIRKILPSETVESARAELQGIVDLFAMNEGLRSEIAFTAARDSRSGGRPSEVDAESDAIRLLTGIVRMATGKERVITGAPFWAEASFFIHDLGVPTVYCGPGDISHCHTTRERVDLDEFLTAVRIFASLIVEYCGVQ
ncbi:MAG: M20/M25/M40 family metallo-hydrolase [Thermomicrobiales bacterium]|nr:M20/M25/M40 family metallo-hydrolase [Thermomicrobiales bacterium]